MRFYLDASVALHAVLPWGDVRARKWLVSLDDGAESLLSSRLLELEMVRVLRRERLDTAWTALVLDRLDVVSLDDHVLQRAADIKPHVKSLDAIHLATCALLGSKVSLVTHDVNMANVAEALGHAVFDPLHDAAR